MMLGVVNEKALHELGWPRLCAELAGRARTPMGRERCLSLVPGDDPAQAALRLARVEEARVLRRHERELPLADAVDVRPSLGRAAREGTLEPPELLQVAPLIRASDSARRFCFSQADRAPLHFELAQQLSELVPLAQELERAFDPGGKLLDTASALLGELRERARGLHRAVKQRLEEMLKDEKIVAMLRDTYYSVRGDRYVLPVRAEHRSHLPGIVHNASNSGQTLFVEPQTLVELGNQLTIAEAGALEEEQRILHELSGAVGRRAPALEHDVEVLAVLDEAAAGGRLADDLDAGAPELGGDRFELRGARHPLLVLQRKPGSVVANDIALPVPAQALIVSGPNAGGKTVTITADTDPREGAAIAVAALEKLVAAGAEVLITTHLEELKALALADRRFAPASVGFDVERLAPTYRLRLGEVGASSAIEIARRVGLPEEVCVRARQILGSGASVVSQAVEMLEKERALTAQARTELGEARAELARERESVVRERARLRELEDE